MNETSPAPVITSPTVPTAQKSMHNKKFTFMVMGVLLVIVAVIAGFRVLQNPINFPNRANELTPTPGGGACFQEFLPNGKDVTCKVYYKTLRGTGAGPSAKVGKVYILNDFGEKVPFNNGSQTEKAEGLPGGDHTQDGVAITFSNITSSVMFADNPQTEGIRQKCILEDVEIIDKCCVESADPNQNTCKKCFAGMPGCEATNSCTRQAVEGFCQTEDSCSCKDVAGDKSTNQDNLKYLANERGAIPYENITLFPEYKDGPKRTEYIDGIIQIKNSILYAPKGAEEHNPDDRFAINCINCSKIYAEIETDEKTQSGDYTFLKITPIPEMDSLKQGASDQACMALASDSSEKVVVMHKKTNLLEIPPSEVAPENYYLRFRCNQARGGKEDDSARTTYFNFENEFPSVKYKTEISCPIEEKYAKLTPTVSYREETCKWGCTAVCPNCPSTGEQPMMSGVRARNKNDGNVWKVIENARCSSIKSIVDPTKQSCDFGFTKFGDTKKWEEPKSDNFRLGNEHNPDKNKPRRGEDPNGLDNACYVTNELMTLSTFSQKNDIVDWDYIDFGGTKRKVITTVNADNGDVKFTYKDGGVYDIALTCSNDAGGYKIGTETYDEVQCVKRIVVACGEPTGGTGGPTTVPPGGNPGSPQVCYETPCDITNPSCDSGMTCAEVYVGNAGTKETRCVKYPENDCKDNPDKPACYCTAPTPSPSPTPGMCKLGVTALCRPISN